MTNFSIWIGGASVARVREASGPVSDSAARGAASPESAARVTAMPQLSREDAWTLLTEWTTSESLLRHMLAVEAAMRAYAPRFDGDVELWGLTGLLHDLDYERHPNLEDGHPRYAIRELEERGYPPELGRPVASPADFMGA